MEITSDNLVCKFCKSSIKPTKGELIPSIYCSTWCEKEDRRRNGVVNWLSIEGMRSMFDEMYIYLRNTKGIVTMKELCVDMGYTENEMLKYVDEYKNDDAIQRTWDGMYDILESRLTKLGMTKWSNSAFIKMMMTNLHRWSVTLKKEEDKQDEGQKFLSELFNRILEGNQAKAQLWGWGVIERATVFRGEAEEVE